MSKIASIFFHSKMLPLINFLSELICSLEFFSKSRPDAADSETDNWQETDFKTGQKILTIAQNL